MLCAAPLFTNLQQQQLAIQSQGRRREGGGGGRQQTKEPKARDTDKTHTARLPLPGSIPASCVCCLPQAGRRKELPANDITKRGFLSSGGTIAAALLRHTCSSHCDVTEWRGTQGGVAARQGRAASTVWRSQQQEDRRGYRAGKGWRPADSVTKQRAVSPQAGACTLPLLTLRRSVSLHFLTESFQVEAATLLPCGQEPPQCRRLPPLSDSVSGI